MGKIIEIPYGEDIIKYVSNLAVEQESKDFGNNTIVFPGKRPALYVRKYLYEKMHSGFIPPLLLSMDMFIQKSYNGNLKLLKNDINFVWMLYNSLGDDIKRLGYGNEFVKFMPWGYKILDLIEELFVEMTDTKDKYYYPNDLPEHIEKIIIDIVNIKNKFGEFIREKGYITRGMMYADVAKNGNFEWLEGRNTIFSGFFALTKSEKTVVHNLLRNENVTYVVQREREKWKHFENTVDLWKGDDEIEYTGNSQITENAEIGITSAFDAHSEIVGIGNVISKTEDKEDIAIVLPDSTQLFPLLNIVMDGVNVPYNITMGYPLSRSPLYSLFNIILQLQENKDSEKYYSSDFIKLLFHPYIKSTHYRGNKFFVRVLFENMRKEITDNKLYFIDYGDIDKTIKGEWTRRMLMREEFQEFSMEDIKNVFAEVFDIFINPFSAIKTLWDLSEAVETVLKYVHEKSDFENYLLNKKFVSKLFELIDSIKSGEIAREQLSVEAIFKIFKKMCEHENVPFIGSPLRPFQIMGLLETRNLRHKRVILADVNEGILPSDDINDPLMPHGLRKILKLPTYESRLEIYRYYFNRILKTSEFVELLYVKNAEKERSRFIEQLLWEGEKRGNQMGKHGYKIKEIKFDIAVKESKTKAIKKDEKIIDLLHSFEYSYSSIDLYMHCPYRFYLEKIQKLKEEEDVEEEFDNRDIGIFMHKALEYLFKDKEFIDVLKKNKETKDIRHFIAMYMERAFKETMGEKTGEKLILFETANMAVENYILNFAKVVNERFSVISTEGMLLGNILLENREIKLEGIVDRIDKFDNRIIINDYKTGSTPKKPKNKEIYKLDMSNLDRTVIKDAFPSIQLPLYAYLYNQGHPDYDFESIDAQLIMLRKKNFKDVTVSFFNKEIEDRRAFIEEKFVPVLRFLIGEILNKDIDFTADKSDSGYCGFCPYRGLCR